MKLVSIPTFLAQVGSIDSIIDTPLPEKNRLDIPSITRLDVKAMPILKLCLNVEIFEYSPNIFSQTPNRQLKLSEMYLKLSSQEFLLTSLYIVLQMANDTHL